jgi:hypothetical protein
MLESCTRTTGDIAGVFEYIYDVGYFYLYNVQDNPNGKILDSIHIVSGNLDFIAGDVLVRWSSNEDKVGLFIRGVLWAVFNFPQHSKYGGHYVAGKAPTLPAIALLGFERFSA